MSRKRSILGPVLLIGGGALAAGLAWFASRKSDDTVDEIERAIAGAGPPDPVTGKRGVVQVRLTGYWPYAATPAERKMEGGVKDRRGNPLYTLEQHQADPVKYPYVSVAGDDAVWPYGQRISISAWPGLVFRVVDTGGHFRGAGKLYRALGHEPLDICVDSSKTVVPKKDVTAQIYPGDNFEKGKAVATGGFKGQNVIVGRRS